MTATGRAKGAQIQIKLAIHLSSPGYICVKCKFDIFKRSSSFVSSNRILPFVYTFSGIFVELLKVIQSAGMC